ncbi:hypothetical protein FH972_008625 [Carpinus fangiana]|uniref:Uncharacterized protein n=1 Tax=Carpinus fangiana TaxID=176857 RepID=A0A5N6QZ94_9ROSI|nr:hypothetical protein FH972_008625 [Carpinus fangiana]
MSDMEKRMKRSFSEEPSKTRRASEEKGTNGDQLQLAVSLNRDNLGKRKMRDFNGGGRMW